MATAPDSTPLGLGTRRTVGPGPAPTGRQAPPPDDGDGFLGPAGTDADPAEADVFLEDFLGDAGDAANDTGQALGTIPLVPPARLSPPADPHMTFPPLTADFKEAKVHIIDPAAVTMDDGLEPSWPEPAAASAANATEYNAGLGDPAPPGDTSAGESSPLPPTSSTQPAPAQRGPLIAAPIPPRRPEPVIPVTPAAQARVMPGWAWFLLGLVLGLIAAILLLAARREPTAAATTTKPAAADDRVKSAELPVEAPAREGADSTR